MISSAQRGRNNLHVSRKASTDKKVSFRLTNNKIPLIIVAVIIIYLSLSLYNQFTRLQVMHNDLERIEKEVDVLKTKNASLRAELKKVQSEAYIEQAAREKLGLVKPGETRIVPVQNTQPKSTP